MSVREVHDSGEARRFLQQGLWLQKVLSPSAAVVQAPLEWALEIASAGDPLLPIGFIADVGHLAFGNDRDLRTGPPAVDVPGWSAGQARTYEDQVLGKLYADGSFERAADAVRRFRGRDRARGLAFLLQQFRLRAGLEGFVLNPAVIKSVLEVPAEEILARGWESLGRDGLLPILPTLYEELIVAVRNVDTILGPEDVFELEHGTALAQFSQRLALRQVLQAAAYLEAELPRQRPRPRASRHDVPTRVLEEDTYPVGGFASLSTRGSVESLLHSQLAYMEKADRPDLFDVKYLRDELLYYARDENQFLRRRRTFVFALFPDLARVRFKDAELPWQRIVLLLGLLVAAVRKLTEWLTTDALRFEIVLLETAGAEPLTAEQALLQMLMREQIANGTVTVERLPAAQLAARCSLRARRSLCHLLTAATTDQDVAPEGTVVTSLTLAESRPTLASGREAWSDLEAEDARAAWAAALERLLQDWL
jgi:hypothetical protein